MLMSTFLKLLPCLVLTLCLSPAVAQARCTGAEVLGGLHDAYRATLLESGETLQQGAMKLLFLAGDQEPTEFSRRVSRAGVELSTDRLSKVLSDGKSLASATLNGTRTDEDRFRHGLNIQWLADVFLQSGCELSPPILGEDTEQLISMSPSIHPKPGMNVGSSKTGQLLLLLAATLVVLGAVLGIHKLHNSFVMRRRRAERLPRTPISLQVQAAYAYPDGTVRSERVEAVDISLGGMKLNWPQPAPAGAQVTLTTPVGERGAQVTWSNSFYAGLMFETQLTDEELQSLIGGAPK